MLNDVIMLSGRFGVGKDFIAEQLVNTLGYTRISFADALKEEVAEQHGISVEELSANKSRYRADLQRIGAEHRAECLSYWIKKWNTKRLKEIGRAHV